MRRYNWTCASCQNFNPFTRAKCVKCGAKYAPPAASVPMSQEGKPIGKVENIRIEEGTGLVANLVLDPALLDTTAEDVLDEGFRRCGARIFEQTIADWEDAASEACAPDVIAERGIP